MISLLSTMHTTTHDKVNPSTTGRPGLIKHHFSLPLILTELLSLSHDDHPASALRSSPSPLPWSILLVRTRCGSVHAAKTSGQFFHRAQYGCNLDVEQTLSEKTCVFALISFAISGKQNTSGFQGDGRGLRYIAACYILLSELRCMRLSCKPASI